MFGGPLLAGWIGWETVFRATAVVLVAWGVVFALFARDPPRTSSPPALVEMLALLRRESLAWVLAAFYFLTFGGFVAFSCSLPVWRSIGSSSASTATPEARIGALGDFLWQFDIVASAASAGSVLAHRAIAVIDSHQGG